MMIKRNFKSLHAAWFSLLPLFCLACHGMQGQRPYLEDSSISSRRTDHVDCDVIVAGGSTAALSAALTSSREGVKTCLVEPTDWLGGQLTANGVPAVDFAWHKVGTLNVGAIAKDPANLPNELVSWMSAIGNPGGCWVSKNCFEPKTLLDNKINPAVKQEAKLLVFRNAVVKNLRTEGEGSLARIAAVQIIQRFSREGLAWDGYDQRLSQDMQDWFSSSDSARFSKKLITLSSSRNNGPVVIDATELGDVLVLSTAKYTQGIESTDGKPTTAVTQCGQAVVFPFVMRLNAASVNSDIPNLPVDHPEFYQLNNTTWDRVWTYRRLLGAGAPAQNDLSLQNWNPGNDWPFGSLFKTPDAARLETSDWRGGVNYQALDAAERHSYGYASWYRNHANAELQERLSLDLAVMGTGHGFSKFPYLRDTRRSIGLDGFVLLLTDLQGDEAQKTGKRFIDRIAVGAYNADIHGMMGCSYPSHKTDTLPFYIPLRALTNATVSNLLVAGKTMAQSFLANAATRVHPVEFSSGIGAGAAAAVMVQENLSTTRELLAQYPKVQTAVKKYAPIDITINAVPYPEPGEVLEPIP